MNLQFVPAEIVDIPVIFAQAENLIETYEDLDSVDYVKVLAWMKQKITKNISEYCCVTADGQKCAYYRLCEDGELDDLYVLPQFQNCGIGSAILKKCITESANNLYLYVFSRNIRAISFYKRFGFSIGETVSGTRVILERKG